MAAWISFHNFLLVIFFTVFKSQLWGLYFTQQDAKIEPEEFTSRLQTELKSSPQPYLVPFLKVVLLLLNIFHLLSKHISSQKVVPWTFAS